MTKYIVRLAALLFLGSAVMSCSTVSDVYSQRNPQWSGQPVQSVMVIGDFPNLVYRRDAESAMCDSIKEASSTTCLQSLAVVFAGENEEEQIAEAMNKFDVGALIYMSNLDTGADVVNSPSISVGTWTGGFITSITSGGTGSISWSNYSVKVYLPDGTMIWNGSINTSGDDKDDFIEDSSEAMADKLLKNGIIELRPNP